MTFSPPHLAGIGPRRLRQQIDVHLRGEVALTHTKAPECAGDRIVGINRHPQDF